MQFVVQQKFKNGIIIPGNLHKRDVCITNQNHELPNKVGVKRKACNAHLGEKVVNYVSLDVVVNLVENSEVTVKCRQPTAQIAPLLHAIQFLELE